jgi:hypothetical protein
MKNLLAVIAIVLLLSNSTLAMKMNDIVTIQLDKPLWALSLQNPEWLLPEKQTEKDVLVFCFSAAQKGTPEDGQSQQEDDLGRTTRALPLYIAERITIETNLNAYNLMPILKGTGPIVAGQRNDPGELASVMTNKPAFIITGHFETDYIGLKRTLVVYLYETASDSETEIVRITKLAKSPADIGSQAADDILTALTQTSHFNFESSSSLFPRPPKKYIREYLDGLGQLFIQTVIQNGYAPAETLWGEDNMIRWYQSLWEALPDSAIPRLMYLRGLLASHQYGTDAYKPHVGRFSEYLMSLQDLNDPLNRLSPLFFEKIDDVTRLEKKIEMLKNIKDSKYQKWFGVFQENRVKSNKTLQ